MTTRPLFAKRTIVQVYTTNGGRITAPLANDHYRSFDATLDLGNDHVVTISCWRISSIEDVTTETIRRAWSHPITHAGT